MNRFDGLAWAAGLFEGEGCFTLMRVRAREHQPNYRPRPAARVNMTDLDVLQRFHRAIRLGRINGPYIRGTHKPYWQWCVDSHAGFAELELTLVPFLGERRTARYYEVRELTA